MVIGEIASNAEYRMGEEFQNCQFFSQILVFQIKNF